MGLSPKEHMEASAAKLKDRTGKSLAEWVKLAKKRRFANAKECRAWLKAEYQLGQNTQFHIAEAVFHEYADPDALLNGMYSGARASLRPLYDAVARMGMQLGKDVTLYQCKTYTVLRRSRQFAVIKPTTQTRMDVGVALPGMKPSGRLLEARNLGGGDRITHRLGVESLKDVDAELKRWLKAAYEGDGGK